MFIFNKTTTNMVMIGLSLSLFTLVACLPDQSRIINAEDIGPRESIYNENNLSEPLQEFLNQNRRRINIVESAFPDNISHDTEDISDDCRQIDRSVISDEEDESTLNIYVGDITDSDTRINVISCGLERFQNNLQNKETASDLMNTVDNLINLINRSDESREIREFYNEYKNNIQVSFQEVGGSIETSFVFRDKLRIEVRDDNYTVTIDSRLDEKIQAHLLAHAISIIKTETFEENVDIVEDRTGLTFATIRQLYYNNNRGSNTGLLVHYFGSNFEKRRDERQIIEAFYFYSRFKAYLVNRSLEERDLDFDYDLSDTAIDGEVMTHLKTRKHFKMDHENRTYHIMYGSPLMNL